MPYLGRRTPANDRSGSCTILVPLAAGRSPRLNIVLRPGESRCGKPQAQGLRSFAIVCSGYHIVQELKPGESNLRRCTRKNQECGIESCGPESTRQRMIRQATR